MIRRRDNRGLCARPSDLMLLRAVLQAGATPGEALTLLADVDPDGPLAPGGRALRAGDRLADIAAAAGPGLRPLLQVLAVTEELGSSSGTAIDGLLDALSSSRRLADLVRVRSADARITARVLFALPVAGALMTLAVAPSARSFMTSTLGGATIAMAGTLMFTAWLWLRRLVQGVPRAARKVDPLGGSHVHASPTADAVELLAVGLASGLPLQSACALVADGGPQPVRDRWREIARALRTGMAPADAFGDALVEVGRLIEATNRWGAPAAPALRLLRRDLHDRAAAACEEAAERLAAQLVFPTTLLLVPAFGLLVVPPILAEAFSGVSLTG